MGCLRLEYLEFTELRTERNNTFARGKNGAGIIVAGLNHVAHQISSPMESMGGDDPKEDSPIMKSLKASLSGIDPDSIISNRIGSNYVAAIDGIYEKNIYYIASDGSDSFASYTTKRTLYVSVPVRNRFGFVKNPVSLMESAVNKGMSALNLFVKASFGNFTAFQADNVLLQTANSYLRFYGGSASLQAPLNFGGIHSTFRPSSFLDDVRNIFK